MEKATLSTLCEDNQKFGDNTIMGTIQKQRWKLIISRSNWPVLRLSTPFGAESDERHYSVGEIRNGSASVHSQTECRKFGRLMHDECKCQA